MSEEFKLEGENRSALHKNTQSTFWDLSDQNISHAKAQGRKGAKKTLGNAAALCAFAREIFPGIRHCKAATLFAF